MRSVEVGIPVDGLRLAGVLRLPSADRAPGLVFTGPFTGVKEQVVGRYAAALTAAGFATLVFDHRNFGASDGPVPQHEDAAGKLADLRAATSLLAADERVDGARLGCVGICLGGGYAVRHAAADPRIGVLAVVAGAYNDPRAMRAGMGAGSYRAVLRELAEVEAAQQRGAPVAYLPAVSGDGGEAAMPGAEPFGYYGTSRAASPGWRNRVTRLSVRELLTFDAAGGADLLDATPTLVVHGRTDAYCSPEQAQALYDRLPGPRELCWLDTAEHVDLYDRPAYVDPAVARVAEWAARWLAPVRTG